MEHLPLVFEPNQGQEAQDVTYLTRTSGYTIFLQSTNTVFWFGAAASGNSEPTMIRLQLEGAKQKATVVLGKRLPGESNYYMGRNPKAWVTHVPQYGGVRFKSVYPGIDIAYYGNEAHLEYDFIVSPGSDPKTISFGITGADSIRLDSSGDLNLTAANATIALHKPVVYQEISGVRHDVGGKFVLRSADEVGFEIEKYDSRRSLIIDPVLSSSTLIGANNSTQVQGIAVDSKKNTYVVGTTFATNYPVVNAFQSTNNGTTSVFVTKLNPAGDAILYSTYLGGSGFSTGRAIAVDSVGSAYVTGNIGEGDFPTTPGAFMTTCAQPCNTPFVTKFLTTGELEFSTFMGGSNTAGNSIAVDSSGEAYITGTTASNDLPTTPGSFEPGYPGQICTSCNNGYVEKLNASGSALVYSTYFGAATGSFPPETVGSGIAVDGTGSAYIVGNTTAIPVQNPIQLSYVGQDSPNAFIAKFSPDGSALAYATYLGGSSQYFFEEGGDYATGVAVDSAGNAHIVGTTSSCDFPLTLNALSTNCVNQEYEQEIFATTISPSGTQILFSTVLGIGLASGIAVDAKGNSYISGDATGNYLPLLNPIVGITQAVAFGDSIGFVSELDLSGNLIFSTYVGGTTSGSNTAGIALDKKGDISLAGLGQADFPLVKPIPSQRVQSTYDTFFVAKISPTNEPQVSLSPLVSPVLQLRNVSSVPLTIDSIVASNNFTQGGTCGTSVAPGSGCTLILEGKDDNKKSGTVTITSNAAKKPERFVIAKNPKGDNVGAVISVYPPSLQFDRQLIGTTSSAQTVVIANSGLQSASITDIEIDPAGTFSQTNNCPAQIDPGTSCTISITYTAVNQLDSAALSVGVAGISYTIYLNGIGSTSSLVVSAYSVQFGEQYAGSQPLGRMLNVINTTPYTTAVSGINTSTSFAETDTCSAALAPNGSCRVLVTFQPAGNQATTGSLTVGSYGPGGPQTIPLYGSGIAPGDLSVSPLALSFIAVVGFKSAPGNVTLTNNSQKAISITQIQTGTPFIQTNNCPQSLVAASTCQITVYFDPTQSGAASGTLQIAFVGNGSPQVIGLTGTTQTIVQFSPATLSFGQVPVNQTSAELTTFVENTGNQTVTLGNVTLQGSNYAIVYDGCGKSLKGDAGCSVGVTFTPSATGQQTGTLSVVASDSTTEHTASLVGIGISNGVGSLSPTSLSFGMQAVGTQSQPLQTTLTNSGTGPLALAGIAVSAQFMQSNNCKSPLAAGASCSISVEFAPTVQGIIDGTLTVQDDGSGGPHTALLSGLAQ
jgi:hypothetical protein